MGDRPVLRVVETGPPEAVSMHELRERLADFQDAYTRCDYLDHWPSVTKCRQLNLDYINRLKAEIRRREAEDKALTTPESWITPEPDDDEHMARPAPLWPAGQESDGD